MSISTPDPFGMTANPETYMPRAATERALAELERALLSGELPVIFTGPPGIGKTLLLRVLERRLAGRVRCVYIGYAALTPAELCGWILGLLGEPAPASGDAEAALLAAAHGFARAGTPLALLIDDASAIPPDTAERIRAVAASSRGALQILAADMEDAAVEPWVTRFGARVERVRLETPMTAAETALYIRARLQRGGASPEDHGRLDAKVIDRICRRSNGIPRAVQALSSEFLRLGLAALPTEALEILLAQEDAADLANRVAASMRAREVLSVQSTGDPEVAPLAPVTKPVPPIPRFSEISEMPSPPPPKSEPPAQESLPGPSPPASLPAKPTPAPQPQERPSPPPASPHSSVIRPVGRRAAVQETPTGGLHWQRILIAALGLGGIVALAIPLLRNVHTVPSAPAPVIDTASPATAPPEAADAPPRTLNAREPSPPSPPESPRPAPPEPSVPPSSGAAQPVPSSSSAPAPRVPAVPVTRIAVHINATPWATIEVDGLDLGETPIAGVPLAPGSHVFKARMPDGRVIERTVQIGAETRYVTFE